MSIGRQGVGGWWPWGRYRLGGVIPGNLAIMSCSGMLRDGPVEQLTAASDVNRICPRD